MNARNEGADLRAPSDDPALRPPRRAWRWALSLVLGVSLLAWTLRTMRDEIVASAPAEDPWAVFFEAFSGVSVAAIAIYAVAFLLMQFVKVQRWGVQLRALGGVDRRTVHHAGFVGFAAIALLPLRLGEIARPALGARASGRPFSALLATTVVERVIDGWVVCAFVFIAWPLAPEPGGHIVFATALASLALFVGVGAAVGLFWWQPRWVERGVTWSVGRWMPRFAQALLGLLREFEAGVRALRGARRFGGYLALTALYWGVNGWGVAYWLGLFGFPLGPLEGIVVVCVLTVGIMLPSGPGFLGNFQVFLLAGVAMWTPLRGDAYASASALAAALSLNVLQLLLQTIAALPSLPWLLRLRASSGRPEGQHVDRA